MRYILHAIILFSPLPFGSARPVWQWMWVCLISLISLTFAIKYVFKKQQFSIEKLDVFQKELQLPILLYIVFLLWVVSQQYVLEEYGINEPTPNFYMHAIFTFFTMHFLLFCSIIATKITIRHIVRSIHLCTVVISIYSIYGLAIYFSGSETILWFKKWASLETVTSTFVNRNSFAAYAGIGLLCNVALLISLLQKNLERNQGTTSFQRLISNINHTDWLLVLCFVIIITALMLTGSRAGIASTFIGLFFLCFSSVPWKSKGTWILLLGSGGLLLILPLELSSSLFLKRLSELDSFSDIRFKVYELMFAASHSASIIGFGAGQFKEVFMVIRTPEITANFHRAHNDYLEIAFTLGYPALLVFVSSVILVIRLLCRALLISDIHRPFIALGISVSLQLAIHSGLDFPLQIPAISYLYVIILALTVSLAIHNKKTIKVFKTSRNQH